MFAVRRGHKYWPGWLDAAGNFTEDPTADVCRVGQPHSIWPEILNEPEEFYTPAYEYRSGYLIKGSFDGRFNFVPEVGSKVIPFKEYRYSRTAPRIYNLPGTFEPVKKSGVVPDHGKEAPGDNSRAEATASEPAHQVGKEDQLYEFKPRPDRQYFLRRAAKYWLGWLDPDGNFILNRKFPSQTEAKVYGLPTHVINEYKPNTPVYEYRSGTLIKGVIDKEFNFVPAVGSRIIPFTQYKYSKSAPLIYNLPGEFVPVKAKGK